MSSPVRSIVHFDLDAFYVHVEYLRDSRLRGKAIAVGGHSDRGVITSCSYEARKFGVRSAMATRIAKRLCPDLIIVRGDMDRYVQYSNLVTDIIRREVPVFEKSSIDEFYIDMTGMDRFFGVVSIIQDIRRKIISQTGLSISYALATNKLVSKIATNEYKPNGQIVIKPGNERSFLAPLAVDKMPMIGSRTAAVLRESGIETLADLSKVPVERLTTLLGKNGVGIWRRSMGEDETPVIPYHEQKSIGTENTFPADTNCKDFLRRELIRMTERIAFELRRNNKITGCVTVKIRYGNFETFTMQSAIPFTSLDNILIQKAKEIFDKLYDKQSMVRLIGIRFSHLITGSYQINLFDDSHQTLSLYKAIDSVKKQFGETLLIHAGSI